MALSLGFELGLIYLGLMWKRLWFNFFGLLRSIGRLFLTPTCHTVIHNWAEKRILKVFGEKLFKKSLLYYKSILYESK